MAERLGQQAADGVDLVVVEVDPEQVADLLEVDPGTDPEGAVQQVLDVRLVAVVLVGDLADDLLDEVLQRDDPGGAAVLVDDDRDVAGARRP
jgi:hypothetical protein